MSAGCVTAGNEGELAVCDGRECVLDGSGSLDTGGVSGRTAQDVVVVDEGHALSLEAINHAGEAEVDKILFLALGVDQNQVSIAHLGVVDGLAGTGGVNLHGVAVLSLELGQQLTQQAGVVDGSGGGQADDLGLFGSGSDLAGVDRSVFLDVEQVGAVLSNTVSASHVQSFLGNQPLIQSGRTGSVDGNIGNSIAVRIHEGSLGIDSDDGVGVQHVVVSFHQDAGVHDQSCLGRSLGGSLGNDGSRSLSGNRCGSFGSSRLGSAAGCQTQDHNQNQQQGNNLLHFRSSKF